MAQLLKMAQFVDQYSVPEMQIRGSWVETSLDTQRAPRLQTLNQLCFYQQFITAAFDQLQTALDVYHFVTPDLRSWRVQRQAIN